MKCLNEAEVFVRVKGITSYSKCLYLIRNLIFQSSPSYYRRVVNNVNIQRYDTKVRGSINEVITQV